MTEPLTSFPIVEIPTNAKSWDKLRLCAPVIMFVPKTLRSKTIRVIKQSSLQTLTNTFNLCRLYQDKLCFHAALAPLLNPSLARMYAAALYKVPEEDHELIVSLMYTAEDRGREEHIYQFLARVENDGLERAVTTALEWENNGGKPIFGEKLEPGSNNSPAATLVKTFLLKVANEGQSMQSRLLAVKWLPYFASSKAECIELINQYLNHDDPHIRCVAALNQALVDPNSKDLNRNLWSPLEDHRWQFCHAISMNGDAGHIERVAMWTLFKRAGLLFPSETLLSQSNESAELWHGQMRVAKPADREATEFHLGQLYKSVGCPPPKAVLWFENPRLAVVASAMIGELVGSGPISKNTIVETSTVARYIRTLKAMMDSYPEFERRGWSSWRFGFPNAEPMLEYDPFPITCGTMLLRSGPRRERDLWDVIGDRIGWKMPDEVSRAWEHLSRNLSGTGELQLLQQCDPASFELKNLFYLSRVLLDRERLRAVGHRSLLKSLGACPHKDDGLEQILLNCGGFVPFENIVIAVERPCRIHLDDQGRLHNASGRSIEYPDDWGCYSVHGITIRNPHIVTNPEQITLEEINDEYNLEVRRVMIEQYGTERFLTESNAEVIHEDSYGVLYKQRLSSWEDLIVVKVRNSTPEPDGSFRYYFLNVPPQIKTAREAVAWTFDMTEDEYNPQIES